MTKRVYIPIAVPGAGKSTWISKELHRMATEEGVKDSVICSADHFFTGSDMVYRFNGSKLKQAHGQCLNRFKQALTDGCSLVVVDNTNIGISNRQVYINLAKQFGYEVVIKVLPCDPEIAFNRCMHNVPLHAIQKMHEALKDQKLV